MPADLHVVFGSGQVGAPLARRLADGGLRVRAVRRSAAPGAGGIETRQGDAADKAFCLEAARGAAVVYHCMNPPYDTRIWAEAVPRYMENLIAAAASAGARLVVLDNLYMLGRPGGRPLDEESPMKPCSRKGEIRASAASRLFDAHRAGEVRATSGRASDYYGPGGTLTGLGDFFWPRALAGRTAYSPAPLDIVHTYHYIPDVVAGLAALGRADDGAYGRPWMLPCQPAGTLRQLIARLAVALGRDLKVRGLPRWLTKAMAIAMPIMRELDEMLYQWDEAVVVDDHQFRERFGLQPEAEALAAEATVAWARQHYATA